MGQHQPVCARPVNSGYESNLAILKAALKCIKLDSLTKRKLEYYDIQLKI